MVPDDKGPAFFATADFVTGWEPRPRRQQVGGGPRIFLASDEPDPTFLGPQIFAESWE
jgi:hypothetical protein